MPAMDHQGGKLRGQVRTEQAEMMDKVNIDLIEDTRFKDIEGLADKLAAFKLKFMEIDEDHNGTIDQMNLKRMLEKLGQAKTHREVMKMIHQVDTTNTGTINYRDFVDMMLGTRTCVLRMILMFEEKNKEKDGPKGPPPQKSLAQLP